MQMNRYPGPTSFGLLPDPEGRSASFVTAATVNLIILGLVLYIGMMAKHVIEQHHFEQTELIFPTTPPPGSQSEGASARRSCHRHPSLEEVKLEQPKINCPRLNQAGAEADRDGSQAEDAADQGWRSQRLFWRRSPKRHWQQPCRRRIVQQNPSTAAVHLGETFGVTPNPNATKPATVAAIGNPYGGMQGPAVAPRGVVGSTGIGNGTQSGSNAGRHGHVASAGHSGWQRELRKGTSGGKVGSAGIPQMTGAAAPAMMKPTRRRRILKSFRSPRCNTPARPGS